jgi:uncharacterized Zn finger protein
MGRYSDRYSQWGKYVSVAERRAKSAKHIATLNKKGIKLNPVVVNGRTISTTFWGKAWCENLETYSDYDNRLPRGRTYVRNGSVIDLKITKGKVKAQVMGSSLYQVNIDVQAIPNAKWKSLIKACAGKIDSLIELLQGKFSKAVMQTMTEKENGLFPKPKEISMTCSCPDSAYMCKHIAAVLYGVGAALDTKPEWLFELRHVEHLDLVATANQGALVAPQATTETFGDSDLSTLFGIEIAPEKASKMASPARQKKPTKKQKPVETKPRHTIKANPKANPSKKKRIRRDDEVIITIVD